MAINEDRAHQLIGEQRPADDMDAKVFKTAQDLLLVSLLSLEFIGPKEMSLPILAHLAALAMATAIEACDGKIARIEMNPAVGILSDDDRIAIHVVEVRRLLEVARKMRQDQNVGNDKKGMN